MSLKIKIVFLMVLMLIIINCGVCFGAMQYLSYSKIENTSDFDISYFIDNSVLPMYIDNSSQVIENLKNNEVVQQFQNECNENNYKYITIFSDATYSSSKYNFVGYRFFLSNDPINVSYYSTTGNYAYQATIKCSSDMLSLYIAKDCKGSLTTYEANSNIKLYVNYLLKCKLRNNASDTGVYAGFFWSTCGLIYNNGYNSLWSDNSEYLNTKPNYITYKTYSILDGYNPNPYFELSESFNQTVDLIIGDEIHVIKSTSEFNKSEPVGRIYTRNPDKLMGVYVSKTVRRSNGNYSFRDSPIYYLYKEDEFINSNRYGYLRPIAPRW